MRRALLALLMLLLAGTAGAQPAAGLIQCGLPADPTQQHGLRADFITLPGLAEWLGKAAPTMQIAKARQTAQAVQALELSVERPAAITPEEWQRAFFEAVAYPAAHRPNQVPGGAISLGQVRPPPPSAQDRRVLSVEFPGLDRGWLPQRWQVVVLACVAELPDPNRAVAKINELRAFGGQPIFVSSWPLSAAIGIGAVVLLYLVVALAAAGVHARQFAHLKAEREAAGLSVSRIGFALNPTVIMQDTFGHCSLARFQVLLFTLVLTGVYAYVMARTGELSGLSPTVLGLLGITLAGSTLARAAGGPVVDTPNRLWLFGTGVLDPTPRQPAWRDLIAGEGEVDVTRVQAVAFSLFAAAALVINGTTDLAGFEIPQEINYLMGISQFVYIAGKALPQEAAKRLNEEVRALRLAEGRVLADAGDAAAAKEFETARNAIGAALFDVFGERFDERALRGLTPGRRRAPPG
jgi:hypothetical protein